MIPSYLFVLASLASLMITVGAFVVALVIMKRNRWRSLSAARLVSIAVYLKLVSYVGGWISTMVMSQTMTPSSMALASRGLQVVQSAIGAAVLILLVRAAFVGRDTEANASVSGAVPAGDTNPYAAPR
ncbi:MAG: hypothetical protein AAFU85_15680 [Planctomycetota bacterium]